MWAGSEATLELAGDSKSNRARPEEWFEPPAENKDDRPRLYEGSPLP